MPDGLQALLVAIKATAAKDTSADPDSWTPENPLWGHCAVAALLVQHYLGGTLLRIDLTSVPNLAHLRSHYINILPDGSICDLTQDQFHRPIPDNLPSERRSRESLLQSPDTNERYRIFKERVEQHLAEAIR